MKLRVNVISLILLNVLLYVILYKIPINSKILENICLIKAITGKECWNCGMTRAFLSILHFDFYSAYKFNKRVFIVFPMTIGIYLYNYYKYFIKGGVEIERKR